MAKRELIYAPLLGQYCESTKLSTYPLVLKRTGQEWGVYEG